jgi:hypothetical protein
MKNWLGKLLVIGVALVVGVFAKELVHSLMSPSTPPSTPSQVEDGFKRAVTLIVPTLPKKIDDATTLTGISSAGMVLTYVYTIDDENYDLQPGFLKAVQTSTTQGVCTKDEMKRDMRAGATYGYSYVSKTAKPLGTFFVRSSDCDGIHGQNR